MSLLVSWIQVETVGDARVLERVLGFGLLLRSSWHQQSLDSWWCNSSCMLDNGGYANDTKKVSLHTAPCCRAASPAFGQKRRQCFHTLVWLALSLSIAEKLLFEMSTVWKRYYLKFRVNNSSLISIVILLHADIDTMLRHPILGIWQFSPYQM